MTVFLLVGRLILAGVFAVAGVSKLADREGSRRTIIDFGLPKALAAPLGLLLPLAELAVAAALVPASTARWGAFGALALLLLFIAGIGISLARGRKPDCHCFGQLYSAPAGWKTLARNGVLAAVAGFLVWQGWNGYTGPSVVSWLGALFAAQAVGLVVGLVALCLVAVQWWFLIHLLGQNGRLLARLEALENGLAGGSMSSNGVAAQPAEGLPVGAQAPAFSLEGLYGEALTLNALRASGKPVMLLFTDPNCGPCTALLPKVERWQREHADKLTISLISRGDPEENRDKSSEHGLARVLLQNDWEVSGAYEVEGTPSAVLVRPDGTIGSPLAVGSEAIESLVVQVVDAPARVPLLPGAPAPATASDNGDCPECGKKHPAPAMLAALKIGDTAPDLELPDLSGSRVSLADFRGEETLVLFWNPGCGFCQQMLPDLKKWEKKPPRRAPKLLVVSGGTEEANKAMGLGSPVVLDQNFTLGGSFGVAGTPSAVLVDAEGKIASEVAVGAPEVLELARVR